MRKRVTALATLATLAATVASSGQGPSAPLVPSHPAIGYSERPADDRVAELGRRLQRGEATLRYDRALGFLPALLDALEVPVESQTLVFSKTSLQVEEIGPDNPRAIYFTDDVSIAWIRSAPVIEIAAHDPEQGVMFYALRQHSAFARRGFQRPRSCLECHIADTTLGVPGMAVGSAVVDADGEPYVAAPVDHRSPVAERWGGWFVTGDTGSGAHIGNTTANGSRPVMTIDPANLNLTSLDGRTDLAGYLSAHSDIAALMVLEHQTHMTNLLTRLGWDYRIADYAGRSTTLSPVGAPVDPALAQMVAEFVDYLLFVDEAPLEDAMRGNAGFETRFAAMGPFDGRGRTLRTLDLEQRLFRYPCSYMIYTAAFDALPPAAQEAIYARMWRILTGGEDAPRYDRLSATDRRAIIEILRETKSDLPSYWD